jgi:hypothetical protein
MENNTMKQTKNQINYTFDFDRYPDIYDEPQEEWTTSPSSSGSASGWTAIELNGDTVAEVYGSTIESQELARLLSSAPDLLRAIKPLVKRIKAEDSWAKDYDQIKFAEEIIAKAGGE